MQNDDSKSLSQFLKTNRAVESEYLPLRGKPLLHLLESGITAKFELSDIWLTSTPFLRLADRGKCRSVRYSRPKRNEKHCSKFVVVLRSETVKSGPDGSSHLRYNCLRNIVESEIFRTSQKSCQVYESAALTAELRAPRLTDILH